MAARATTISVNTTADDTTINGNCTLREAVIAANTDAAVDGCAAGAGADIIMVPAGTYTLTLTGLNEDAGATGDLDVTDDVQINGSAASTTTIDGYDADRIFDIDPAAAGTITVQLTDLTIQNGNLVSEGGAIRNRGTLTLSRCVVADNVLAGVNVAGGGISNEATLEINQSTVRDNRAVRTAGFIGTATGGGIFNDGSLVMIDSTTSDNFAAGGITPGSGGGIYSTGAMTLTGSTVNGNTAQSGISPGFGGGGGLTIFDVDAVIANSTITENRGFIGGGIAFGSNGNQVLTLENSTISHNFGAGIDAQPNVTVILRNTIVANNPSGDCTVFFGGLFPSTADNYNLDSDGSCGFSGTDLVDVDPLLGPLQDNGGPTLTRTLLAGSPAREGGSPAVPGSGGTACTANDQRGVMRPQSVRCDIGAVEADACGNGVVDAGEACDDGNATPGDGCTACSVDTYLLNHYQCYQGKDLRMPTFSKSMVTVSDQIGEETVELQKLKFVCNPVSKNGEGIHDPNAHLTCYQVKATNLTPRPRFLVSTQFQQSRFEAKKAKLLCLPSTKTLVP